MLRLGSSGSGEWLLADIGGESLDLGEDLQGSVWACAVPFGFQAHVHDAVRGSHASGVGNATMPIAWMDNVVLLNDAPNRDNAIRFMDFLLEPENVGMLTNWTRYSAGIDGVDAYLDPELAAQPERNPPQDAGPATFIEVCDQATQEVHDRIWTALRR